MKLLNEDSARFRREIKNLQKYYINVLNIYQMVSSKYVHKFLIRYTQSGTLYSFLSHTHNRSIKKSHTKLVLWNFFQLDFFYYQFSSLINKKEICFHDHLNGYFMQIVDKIHTHNIYFFVGLSSETIYAYYDTQVTDEKWNGPPVKWILK